jgi:hypothetical protein
MLQSNTVCYSLLNRCHFRASNFLIKSTIKVYVINKKKNISLEEKLHIPLVAQFGIKNTAIAVQLGRNICTIQRDIKAQ